MLNVGLIGGQLSNVEAIIKPSGLSFQDMTKGTVGVYAIFQKDFFPKDGFNNTNEKIIVTDKLLDVLGKEFKNDEQIELYTEENRLYVEGARIKFEDTIPVSEEERTFPAQMKSETYGIIPEKADLTKAVIAKFSVDELQFMEADKYNFVSDGKSLSVRLEFSDTSALTKTLKPVSMISMPEMSATFAKEYYNAGIKPLTGEVWFIMIDDSIFLTKKEKTSSITMMIAGYEVT